MWVGGIFNLFCLSFLHRNGPKLLNHKSATADDIRKIKADHGFKIKHFDFQSSYMAKSVDNESHLLTFVNVEYVQVTAKFEVNQKNLTTSDLAAALHLVRKSLLKGFRKDETRQLYKITEKGLKNLSDFYVTDAVIEQPENLHPLVVNIHFTFEILANELSEIKKN